MSEQLIAAIDFGTNTARLLIGNILQSGQIRRLLVKRHITRLGGEFSKEHGISGNAWERGIEAIKGFAAEIARHDVKIVKAVATSAVRDATNGVKFCEEVLRETGIRLEIIDGHEEAFLTLSGVLTGLINPKEYMMVFDVGGGSTEYTFARKDAPLFTKSLPLGVVRLTEGKVTPEAILEKIRRELTLLYSDLKNAGLLEKFSNACLVGTAGTATTLAAIDIKMIDYDYSRVNNHILKIEQVKDIYKELLPLTPSERLLVKGLEAGREDLIIAGILITLTTMNIFNFKEMTVSDNGMLEGLLLSAPS